MSLFFRNINKLDYKSACVTVCGWRLPTPRLSYPPRQDSPECFCDGVPEIMTSRQKDRLATAK